MLVIFISANFEIRAPRKAGWEQALVATSSPSIYSMSFVGSSVTHPYLDTLKLP